MIRAPAVTKGCARGHKTESCCRHWAGESPARGPGPPANDRRNRRGRGSGRSIAATATAGPRGQQPHRRMGGQQRQPALQIKVEGEPTTLHQHRHVPTADRGHQQPGEPARPAGAVNRPIDSSQGNRAQPQTGPVSPPDQRMGVGCLTSSASVKALVKWCGGTIRRGQQHGKSRNTTEIAPNSPRPIMRRQAAIDTSKTDQQLHNKKINVCTKAPA